MRRALVLAAVAASTLPVAAQQVTGLAGFHRSGQTFLTWSEVAPTGERYRVYRHSQPITSGNLAQATRVAELDDRTSAHLQERSHPSPVQQNFVIQDLGPELSDDTGLFVWTASQGGGAYYAVTAVIGGNENTAISGANSIGPVAEQVADPRPVLVWVSGSGWGRIYTQFMDHSQWNPTFEGYAYNYNVTVPPGYNGQTALPMSVALEGYGNRYAHETETPWGWQLININIDEPNQTWYFGFAESWDYAQGQPASGNIRNFTEERLLRSVHDVIQDAYYNVDDDRVYVYGFSMGGSGSLALAMRYPDVFAAAYADMPMTDYRAAALGGWSWDLPGKWGDVALNLPVVSRGRYAGPLAAFDGTGVYDWMDHQQMLVTRRGAEMAYIACDHGSWDTTIEWQEEGRPFYAPIQQGRRAFAGEVVPDGHTWQNFVGMPPNWVFWDFEFRNRESFPAFSYSSGSSPLDPGDYGASAVYNQTLEWSCSWHAFATPIVDTATQYEIVLRATGAAETVDVTPRRLQSFGHAPGTAVAWRVEELSGALRQSGNVTADADGLVIVPGVVVTPAGVRLELTGTPPAGGGNLLVAPGPGDPNPPQVKGYTGGGAPIGALSFTAYGVAKWGANVAAGSIDGTGDDEVLTGPGPGSVFGPQVRAFDRASTPIGKVNFFAYGTLRYGVNVAARGIDGDGPAEILTGAGPGAVFGPHVRGFNYDGVAVAALAKVSFFAYGTLKYGASVHGGRVDGDAFAELLTGPGPGAVFGSQLRGFDYDGASIVAMAKINAFVFTGSLYGLNVAGGSVDGDAFEEIVTGKGPGPANDARVKLMNYDGATLAAMPGGELDAFPGATHGVFVGSGDVDGDGPAEVLVGSGASPSFASALVGYDYSGALQPIAALSLSPFPGLSYGLKVSGGSFGY